MTDRELQRILRNLPEERAGAHFTSEVLARLDASTLDQRSTKASPRTRPPWSWGTAAAVSALLVAALAIAFFAAQPPRETEIPTMVQAEGLAVSPTAPSVARPGPATERVRRQGPQTATRQQRIARLESLLGEQRKLSAELGELRRGLSQEPVLYVAERGGPGLLLPLEGSGALSGTESKPSTASRPTSRPRVHVVPAVNPIY